MMTTGMSRAFFGAAASAVMVAVALTCGGAIAFADDSQQEESIGVTEQAETAVPEADAQFDADQGEATVVGLDAVSSAGQVIDDGIASDNAPSDVENPTDHDVVDDSSGFGNQTGIGLEEEYSGSGEGDEASGECEGSEAVFAGTEVGDEEGSSSADSPDAEALQEGENLPSDEEEAIITESAYQGGEVVGGNSAADDSTLAIVEDQEKIAVADGNHAFEAEEATQNLLADASEQHETETEQPGRQQATAAQPAQVETKPAASAAQPAQKPAKPQANTAGITLSIQTESSGKASTPKVTQALKAGTYVFVTNVRGLVLGVKDASTKAGASVVLVKYTGSSTQKWTIVLADDGYAFLKGAGGNVMELAGSTAKDGANVRIAVQTGGKNQKWRIVKNSNGTYKIVSAFSSYCVQVKGTSAAGANVVIGAKKNTTAQNWRPYNAKPKVVATDTVKDGWYTLRLAKSPSYCANVAGSKAATGTAIQLKKKNAGTGQAFRIFKSGNYYRIQTAVGNGLYVDIYGGRVVPGTKVDISDKEANRTLFSLKRNSDGSYRIVNVASNLALGVYGSKVSNGTALTGEAFSYTAKGQSFVLERRPGIYENGVYTIRTMQSGHRSVGALKGSRSAGAKMALSSYAGDLCLKWQVKGVSGKNNTYTLECLDTGLYMQGADKAAATQAKKNGKSTQWWIPVGSGYGCFWKNAATGQVLDAFYAKNTQGALVYCYTKNGGTNQKWTVDPVPALDSGVYEFANAGGSALVLDVWGKSQEECGNVAVGTRNNGENQRWYYNAADKTLVSLSSGKLLDIDHALETSGTNIFQHSDNGGSNQRWTVQYVGGGRFKIASAMGSNLVVGAHEASSGANVESVTYTGAALQKWRPKRCDFQLASSLQQSLAGVDMTGVRGVGIDVSQWQGDINWGAVKSAGVDFAIIRVGHGTAISDSQLVGNIRGCRSVGIKYGLYYYSTARTVTQAREEASHALTLMKNAGITPSNTSYPIYYDLEEPDMADTSNRKLFAQMTSTFLGKMKEKGYSVGVYSNLNWWNNYLTDSSFSKYDRWVAQWRVPHTDYTGNYSFWQCSSTGRIPGISTDVDIDIRYK